MQSSRFPSAARCSALALGLLALAGCHDQAPAPAAGKTAAELAESEKKWGVNEPVAPKPGEPAPPVATAPTLPAPDDAGSTASGVDQVPGWVTPDQAAKVSLDKTVSIAELAAVARLPDSDRRLKFRIIRVRGIVGSYAKSGAHETLTVTADPGPASKINPTCTCQLADAEYSGPSKRDDRAHIPGGKPVVLSGVYRKGGSAGPSLDRCTVSLGND